MIHVFRAVGMTAFIAFAVIYVFQVERHNKKLAYDRD
jgi:hypothetical protein